MTNGVTSDRRTSEEEKWEVHMKGTESKLVEYISELGTTEELYQEAQH